MTDANISHESNPPAKKKRSLPGTPDPEAEVIALSPKSLMARNRFLCEICGKGFQRDQNLQLHRRGHNLPWKLKQRGNDDVRKRVYVCPETACVHHEASRALGDLTGIKKHFCRKHGEKKWKCDKCSKRYAVQSDWKAHSKTCGTREYKCDSCGSIFSRRDSFITHRAFCEALAQETARVTASQHMMNNNIHYHFIGSMGHHFPSIFKPISSDEQNIDPIPLDRPLSFLDAPVPKTLQQMQSTTIGNLSHDHHQSFSALLSNPNPNYRDFCNKFSSNEANDDHNHLIPLTSVPSMFSTQYLVGHDQSDPATSATALLQKAAQMGAKTSTDPWLTFDINSSGNKLLCELYGTSSVTSGHGSDVESSLNDHSALNQLQLYSNSNCKRRRLQYEEGETRDFLGIGINNPIFHPSIDGYDN